MQELVIGGDVLAFPINNVRAWVVVFPTPTASQAVSRVLRRLQSKGHLYITTDNTMVVHDCNADHPEVITDDVTWLRTQGCTVLDMTGCLRWSPDISTVDEGEAEPDMFVVTRAYLRSTERLYTSPMGWVYDTEEAAQDQMRHVNECHACQGKEVMETDAIFSGACVTRVAVVPF